MPNTLAYLARRAIRVDHGLEPVVDPDTSSADPSRLQVDASSWQGP